jgi:hypothetical protein
MSTPNNGLGQCSPSLVGHSMLGYFGPGLENDPEVSATVFGLGDVSAHDALRVIASGRLPKNDKVKARMDQYAVQFLIDCPKILSVRTLVSPDPVVAEALSRSTDATCRLILGSVPMSEKAEEMVLPRKKFVQACAVRIREKMSRPDLCGLCQPHDHTHLLIHPHAYVDGEARMIFRDPLLRAAPLYTDLHQQGLKRLLTACGYDFNLLPETRAWEEAFSITHRGERKRKVPFTVAEMRPRWLEIAQRLRLPELKPLQAPKEWPVPITPEMILETAARHNWFLLPDQKAAIESLGRQARTLYTFGRRVMLRHNRKADAIRAEALKTENGIDVVITVGGPKYGPIFRAAEAAFTSIDIETAAKEFVGKTEEKEKEANHAGSEEPAVVGTKTNPQKQKGKNGNQPGSKKPAAARKKTENDKRKAPVIVDSAGGDQSNAAIRDVLIRDGVIGEDVGVVEMAVPSGQKDGHEVTDDELHHFVGGFASPINHVSKDWLRGQHRKITRIEGRQIFCADTSNPVDANRLTFSLSRTIVLRRGDWLRLTHDFKKLAKGRLLRVHQVHGNVIESTAGKKIPATKLDWAFCTADPKFGVSHLSHPISAVHEAIGCLNPRLCPTHEQIEALAALAYPDGKTEALDGCESVFLNAVLARCDKLKPSVRKLVAQYFAAFDVLSQEAKPTRKSGEPAEPMDSNLTETPVAEDAPLSEREIGEKPDLARDDETQPKSVVPAPDKTVSAGNTPTSSSAEVTPKPSGESLTRGESRLRQRSPGPYLPDIEIKIPVLALQPAGKNQTFTPDQLSKLKDARTRIDEGAAKASVGYIIMLERAEAIAAKQALRGPEPEPASPTFEIS